MRVLILIICLFTAVSTPLQAQRLNAATHSQNEFAIAYENDFFAYTDYYYTQGVQLSYNHPKLSRGFLSKLMLKLDSAQAITGIAAEGDCYTPTSILSDTIITGDRPFAASVMPHYYMSTKRGIFGLSTRLTIGILGPAAGGYEIQKGIHENTGNPVPHGWQYQIANTPIINYEIGGTQHLFFEKHTGLFSVDAFCKISAGTYLDKIAAGLDLKLGIFHNEWESAPQKRFEIYLEEKPAGALIGYDGTLQGGVFDHRSPYTISAKDLTRATFSNTLSATIAVRFLLISASYTTLTKEFNSGRNHAWGGISASILFR